MRLIAVGRDPEIGFSLKSSFSSLNILLRSSGSLDILLPDMTRLCNECIFSRTCGKEEKLQGVLIRSMCIWVAQNFNYFRSLLFGVC